VLIDFGGRTAGLMVTDMIVGVDSSRYAGTRRRGAPHVISPLPIRRVQLRQFGKVTGKLEGAGNLICGCHAAALYSWMSL